MHQVSVSRQKQRRGGEGHSASRANAREEWAGPLSSGVHSLPLLLGVSGTLPPLDTLSLVPIPGTCPLTLRVGLPVGWKDSTVPQSSVLSGNAESAADHALPAKHDLRVKNTLCWEKTRRPGKFSTIYNHPPNHMYKLIF